MTQPRAISDAAPAGWRPDRSRYAFALACVAAAAGAVAVAEVIVALTPLVLFAVAVAVSAARGGTKPGLLAAGMAALVSNFLFVAPRYELSFDRDVAGLVAVYLVAVPLARLVASRVRSGRPTHHGPAALARPVPQWLAPALVTFCGVAALAAALAMNLRGYPSPAPVAVVAAVVFAAGAAAWGTRGR